MIFSIEHKKRLSEARLRVKAKLGYINSPETRKKMSISAKNKKLSEEHKRNIGEAHKGEKSHLWKGGLPKCICGKKLSAYTSKQCQTCFHNQHKGSNHYNWKQDRNSLVKKQKRNDLAYRDWRKEVWLRDNFKCKIDNSDCEGRIEAHHILGWKDYPDLRYKINNGITLCHAHHPRKRAEEKRLIPTFTELVSVLNETV